MADAPAVEAKVPPGAGPSVLVAPPVVRDRPGEGFCHVTCEESKIGSSIRAIVRRTMGSPAGGLVATALAWAVVWPWLSHRRHTPAAT
jgi:hypothetical protein